MKRNVLSVLFFIVIFFSARAQDMAPSVINSAGGTYKSGNVTYEWSVGELALINEMESPAKDIVITNGFFQTYAMHGKKDSIAKPFAGKEIIILPNPTKGKLQVNFDFIEGGKLKLSMYDEIGFPLYKKEMAASHLLTSEIINMQHYANGNYFLVVELIPNYRRSKKQQTFKIVKVQ